MPKPIVVLRDALIVFAATFVGGFLVGAALGEANRGTPLWRVSMTVVGAIFSIGAFLASAHLATTNRFVHVWTVAAIGVIPTCIFVSLQEHLTIAHVLGALAFLFVYSSAGAGLSYALRRSNRASDSSAV